MNSLFVMFGCEATAIFLLFTEGDMYFNAAKIELEYCVLPKVDLLMAHFTSHQALKLAADFACRAEQMRTSGSSDFQTMADIYERASRVAFLRAHLIAKDEEIRPRFGENLPRAVFAVA